MNNSMINPSIVDLLDKVDNRYSLVIVTSKRARQLIDGQEPRVDVDSKKPLTIAINEVNDLEITFEQVKEGYK
ncbi:MULTISPECIES: DNA-directed RNA polymerase subunit omega [Clostridium]|uniref:DNA-directed RNA polymerase subunit omega n=1 Tax=Clostridium paridis TaxID=2803863 RepID=A0A937FDI0_9CLOT|nr:MULTISPECIES: DNA-directed RNA polymerase subunit omega [Clostridium]MBL4930820.1 DNA-directed RNA polymerase subunit omega [Clostridium paridis]